MAADPGDFNLITIFAGALFAAAVKNSYFSVLQVFLVAFALLFVMWRADFIGKEKRNKPRNKVFRKNGLKTGNNGDFSTSAEEIPEATLIVESHFGTQVLRNDPVYGIRIHPASDTLSGSTGMACVIPIKFSNNPDLLPGAYQIFINDSVKAKGFLAPNHLFAVGPRTILEKIAAGSLTEVVPGFSGVWIRPELRQGIAEGDILTFEPEQILIIHIKEVLRTSPFELKSYLHSCRPPGPAGGVVSHTLSENGISARPGGDSSSFPVPDEQSKMKDTPVVSSSTTVAPPPSFSDSTASQGATRDGVEKVVDRIKRKKEDEKKLAAALGNILQEAEQKYKNRVEENRTSARSEDLLPETLLKPHAEFQGYNGEKREDSASGLPYDEMTRQAFSAQFNVLEIELGKNLLPLVNPANGARMIQHVPDIRRSFMMETGIFLPGVRLRDNLALQPDAYVIRIREVTVGGGTIRTGRLLALHRDEGMLQLPGERTADFLPFGIHGIWIDHEHRPKAMDLGCKVLDDTGAIGMKLLEVCRRYGAEFIGRQEVQVLIESVQKSRPLVVRELMSSLMSVGEIKSVLRTLARERVSIRDMETILETLADTIYLTRNTDLLAENVRVALGRAICHQHADENGFLNCLTLDTTLERRLTDMVVESNFNTFINAGFELTLVIQEKLGIELAKLHSMKVYPVCVVDPRIRLGFRKMIEFRFPDLAVLSQREIVPEVFVNKVGVISI